MNHLHVQNIQFTGWNNSIHQNKLNPLKSLLINIHVFVAFKKVTYLWYEFSLLKFVFFQ